MKLHRPEVLLVTFGYITVLSVQVAESNEHGRHHKWGPWSQWSPCNAECGTGVSVRVRECLDRIKPENCRANKKQFKVCNREECQLDQQNLRQRQCSAHNDKEFRGRIYRWLPYVLNHEECEMTCKAQGYGFYNAFPEPITNGTLCSKDGTSVCIEGVCTKIGCDNIAGSNAKFDMCGVCKGNNSSCTLISDVFDRQSLGYGGYHHIGTIPKNARNINITQLRRSRNFLAIRPKNGAYIINGNRRLSRDGKYEGLGTNFRYHRRRTSRCPGECILARGPTTQELDLMVLSFSQNPGIVYHYSLPNTHVTNENLQDIDISPTSTYEAIIVEDHFNLHHKSKDRKDVISATTNESLYDNSNDSVSYSQENDNGTDWNNSSSRRQSDGNMPGYTQSFTFLDKIVEKNRRNKNRQQQKARLRDNPTVYSGINKIQSDKLLPNGKRYGETGNETDISNVVPGTYRWEITGYTPCSKACGGGEKTPIAECFYGNIKVEEAKCSQIVRDKKSLLPIPCNTESCTNRWHTSDWSRCSVTCGRGRQTRVLTCVHEVAPSVMVSTEDSNCYGLPRPATTQTCLINDCNRWKTERWGECSVSCGSGKKTRRVYCTSDQGRQIRDEYCDAISKPQADTPCNNGVCSRTSSVYVSMRSWYHTEWPETCPTECGKGKQVRKVQCLGTDVNTDPTKSCLQSNKPDTERECMSRRSCSGMWFSGDWGKCNVTCGEGYQSRDVLCVRKDNSGRYSLLREYNCPKKDKPEDIKSCFVRRRCLPEWYLSEWSECSVTCGRGTKRRDAKCININGRPSRRCSERDKPDTTDTCQMSPCSYRNAIDNTYSDAKCLDKYRHCQLVVGAGLCSKEYYRSKCCDSCLRSTRGK